MQPQDPMIEVYKRLYGQLDIDIPGAFYTGQKRAQDLAAGRSEEALKREQIMQARLQSQYMPERMQMDREQFGMSKQKFGTEMDTYNYEKMMRDLYGRREAEAGITSKESEASIKKFQAEHQLELFELNKQESKQRMALENARINLERTRVKLAQGRATKEDTMMARSQIAALRQGITGMEAMQFQWMKMWKEAKEGRFGTDPLSGKPMMITPPDRDLMEQAARKVTLFRDDIATAKKYLGEMGVPLTSSPYMPGVGQGFNSPYLPWDPNTMDATGLPNFKYPGGDTGVQPANPFLYPEEEY